MRYITSNNVTQNTTLNTSRYIFLQSSNSNWNLAFTENTQTCRLNWQEVDSDKTLKDLINQLVAEYDAKVIVMPQFSLIKNSAYNQILLISKGTKELFSSLFPEQSNQFWEVEEDISIQGEVRKALSEPEINNALRNIFRYRSKEVIFLLSNTAFNPLHQANIKNVLHTAGVRSIIATLDLRD